jgi:hypothetical protein
MMPFTKTIAVLFVIAFLVTGCQQAGRDTVDTLAAGPDFGTMPLPPDYLSQAIVATGRMQQWTKTTKLDLDGVLALYQPDGSTYLTQWRWEIYPWSNSVRISGIEPDGEFTWELSQGQFRILAGTDVAASSFGRISQSDLSEVVLTIITAPIRCLNASNRLTRAPEPIKVQGLWYYAIKQTLGGQTGSQNNKRLDMELRQPYWTAVVFYQNRDNSLIDVVRFSDAGKGKFLLARGYDYMRLQKKAMLLPARIEIFKTDVRGAMPQRLAQVSFN